MKIRIATFCAALAALAALTAVTPAWAACKDCDSYTAYCSGACGSFAYDKWRCLTGPSYSYQSCTPHFQSCRIDSGGEVYEDCEGWCEASGDCSSMASIQETPNGTLLASWTNGGGVTNKLCLASADAD
jgi:hypothetical protein